MVTSPGQISVNHIIHAIGPIYNEKNNDQDNVGELITTVKSALRKADSIGCKSIAFPPISSGAYGGFPAHLCAEAFFEGVKEWSDERIMLVDKMPKQIKRTLELIRLVSSHTETFDAFTN
jgi:O-acetyl-ADP-ribose deacetylase (regulator of RNase III)